MNWPTIGFITGIVSIAVNFWILRRISSLIKDDEERGGWH